MDGIPLGMNSMLEYQIIIAEALWLIEAQPPQRLDKKGGQSNMKSM